MVGLAVVFALAYRAFRQEAAQQILERDRQVVLLSASRLRTDLEAFADLLVTVGRTPELTAGASAARRVLQAAGPRLSVFDGGVVLLDSRGIVRAAMPDESAPIGADWSNRDFFREILGETEVFVSDAQSVGEQEASVVAVAVPLRGQADQFEGALTGLFRLGEPTRSSLYASIVRLRLDTAGEASIVDSRGRILYSTDAAEIGHSVTGSELRWLVDSEESTAELTRDPAGEEIIVAHAPVPRSNWTLVNQADWATVTRATSRYRNILFVAFGAALLLPPLMLALITRQRRFRFFEPHHRDDDAWVRAARSHLLPSPWPVLPGWNLAGRCLAGKRNAHDFVDGLILPDGRLMLAIGSVEGRGLRAALTLASTRTVLRACGQRLTMPDDSLRQCNASLCLQPESQDHVRCIVVHLDPRTGWLDYACAGTGALVTRAGFVFQNVAASGHPMGSNPQAVFEVGRLRMEPGQLMVLVGPSMAEARDSADRPFLTEPLAGVLQEERLGPEDLMEKIRRAFRTFNARSPQFDPDLAILVLERLERRARS